MIISFSGKARSGKDTLANVLCEKFGYQRLSFAECLKDMCWFATELPQEYFYSDELKDKPFVDPFALNEHFLSRLLTSSSEIMQITDEQKLSIKELCSNRTVATPRELLQFVGTNLIRDIVGNDFWSTIIKKKIQPNKKYVISDCRFSNERKMLRELGAHLFLIRRSNFQLTSNHFSENDLGSNEDYDFVINNSGTRGEFILNFLNDYSNLF